MTNLERTEAEARDEDYFGNISNLPKIPTTLPCYKGRVQGKPALVLIDTGATVNLVNRTFLDDPQVARRPDDATTIYLADGTTRGECPVHQELKVELGPSVTKIQATAMNLQHFDAILGIPWLMKARPRFDWDRHALIMDAETVWPIHCVTQRELPDDYPGASDDHDSKRE